MGSGDGRHVLYRGRRPPPHLMKLKGYGNNKGVPEGTPYLCDLPTLNCGNYGDGGGTSVSV